MKELNFQDLLNTLPLLDKHASDLVRSGITPEQARIAGIRSVTDPAIISKILNWDKPAKNLGSCMLFTFRALKGDVIDDYARLKPDKPRKSKKKEDNGKPIKYESPKGKSNRAFFPAAVLSVLNDKQIPLIVTEGEKKSLKATLEGFPTIGLVGVWGWIKKRPKGVNGQSIGARELIDDLAGIEWQSRWVSIVFDSDAARNTSVQSAQRYLAETLMKAGACVKIVQLPDGPVGKDGLPTKIGLDDYLVSNSTDDLSKLIDDTSVASADTLSADAGAIMIVTDEYRVNDEVVQKLAGDPELYQSGNLLVRVLREPESEEPGLHLPAAPRIDPIPLPALRERITTVAKFEGLNSHGNIVPKHPPAWCVGAIQARGNWDGIRPLDGVVPFPILRRDGSILQAPGYDRATRLYLDWPHAPLSIIDRPTRNDAMSAVAELLDVVVDFPFKAEMHKAAWLAGLLTPLARSAIDGPSPLFLVDSNVRGSGKGLLLGVMAKIILGTEMAIATYPRDEDELRKKITACLVRGDRMITLDNLSGQFGNATLDAILTATHWRDRILGESRMYDGPALAVWYGTGNNVLIGADTSRRICHIRLESDREKPEEREGFKYPNLLASVGQHRFRLLAAALTILRAYFLAGKTDMGPSAWGSYESWSAIIRNAIVWCGLPDPGETRAVIQEQSDETARGLRQLLIALEMIDPNRNGLTAAEIVGVAYDENSPHSPEVREMLRDAIDALIAKPDGRKLGNRLRHLRRRVVDGRFIDLTGKSTGTNRWGVCKAENFQERPETHPSHTPHTPNYSPDCPKQVDVEDVEDVFSPNAGENSASRQTIPPDREGF